MGKGKYWQSKKLSAVITVRTTERSARRFRKIAYGGSRSDIFNLLVVPFLHNPDLLALIAMQRSAASQFARNENTESYEQKQS